MLFQIYKALDNPPSTFGLKGSYFKFALAGFAAAAVIALIIGSLINGLIAILAFVGMGAGVYMGTMAFQAKFSERDRNKWIASRKLPDVVSVGPTPFYKLAKNKFTVASNIKKKQT